MSIELYENEIKEREAQIKSLKDSLSTMRVENKDLRASNIEKDERIIQLKAGITVAIEILGTSGFLNGQGSKERALTILKEIL